MFGRKKERPISFFFSAKDGALHLYPDRLEKKGGGSVEALPLSQLEGVRLEDGEELSSRVTMTRLVTLGVFALAAKKKAGGEKFLTIESPDIFWTIEVPRKNVGAAQRFIGDIEQLTIISRDPAAPPAEYIKVSGGIFRDMTIHDFDTARFFLGEIEEVYAAGQNLDPALKDTGDFDAAVVTLDDLLQYIGDDTTLAAHLPAMQEYRRRYGAGR